MTTLRTTWTADRGWLLLSLIFLCGLAGAAVAGIGLVQVQDSHLVIAAIAAIALAPVGYRLATGQFDLFEPIVLVAASVLILFVARPLYDLSVGNLRYINLDLQATYASALVAALVCTLGIVAGYFGLGAARVAKLLPALPPKLDPGASLRVAAAITTIMLAALVPLLLNAGAAGQLLTDRSTATALDVPPILLESTLLAAPCLLLLTVSWRTHRWQTAALLAVVLCMLLIVVVPGGNRRYLLAVIIPFAALWYLRRDTRPRVWVGLLLASALIVVLITPVRESRTGQVAFVDALGESLRYPLTSIQDSLVKTDDTAMINVIAYEVSVMGTVIPYRHGAEFTTNTILSPVPREIWPGKPQRLREILTSYAFGTNDRGLCISHCPTYSLVGELYGDFGLPSVLVGSALFGFLLALAYQYFLLFRYSIVAQLSFAMVLWIPYYSLRSGFAEIPELLVVFLTPLAAVLYLTARRAQPSAL